MTKKELDWWEYLDWNKMELSWSMLTEEIKNKIREAGLAPTFDVQSSGEKMNDGN